MTAEEYRNYLEQDFSDVDINEMTDLRMIKWKVTAFLTRKL